MKRDLDLMSVPVTEDRHETDYVFSFLSTSSHVSSSAGSLSARTTTTPTLTNKKTSSTSVRLIGPRSRL